MQAYIITTPEMLEELSFKSAMSSAGHWVSGHAPQILRAGAGAIQGWRGGLMELSDEDLEEMSFKSAMSAAGHWTSDHAPQLLRAGAGAIQGWRGGLMELSDEDLEELYAPYPYPSHSLNYGIRI